MEKPISSNALAQVQAALFNGEKITAIKIYRQDTGASLAEAKAAVERLELEWRAVFPENFKAPARKKGCAGCLIVIIVLTVFALILPSLVFHRSTVASR